VNPTRIPRITPGQVRSLFQQDVAPMTDRRVITTCQFRRPDYTRQMLAGLRACEGIGEYTILAHLEPGDEEVHALIRAIDFAECRRVENVHRLGVNVNAENALRHGFSLADYVIHLEDDIICAPDALRYYEWCRDRYGADPRVFSVTGYNRRSTPAPPSEYHAVHLRKWFHPWGFAIWRDRWDLFQGRLYSRFDVTWDVFLNETFCRGGTTPRCHEVYPELSRSQNVGLKTSRRTAMPTAHWSEHMLKYWAADLDYPAEAFHEVAAP
jgi:hypothetical protein